MKVLKGFGLFLAFILSIVFFILLSIFSIVFFVRNTTTKEQITKYIESADVYNVKSSDIFGSGDTTLEEAIKEELKKNNLTTTIVDEIIEKKSFTNLLGDYSYRYINYILKDSEKPVLTESDLLQVVNIPTLEYHFGRSLTDKEKEYFDKTIDDIVLSLNEQIIDRNEFMTKNIDEIISYIYHEDLKTYFIVGITIIVVLLFILTFSFYKPLLFLSLPAVILGMIISIISIVLKVIVNFVIKADGTVEHIIKNVFNEVTLDILKMGLIYVVIGIVLYIIYKILKKILYKEKDVYLDIEDNVNPLMKEKVLR